MSDPVDPDASAATGAGGALADRPALVFRWRDDAGRAAFRLAVFLILSVAVHLAFFYLVRVIDPPSERILPAEARLLVLHPSNPLVGPLLEGLEDRLAPVSSTLTAGRDLGPTLEEAGVAYLPTYAGFEPSLVEWPESESPAVLPELVAPAEIEFPRVPEIGRPSAGVGAVAAPVGAAADAKVVFEISGDLSTRPIVHEPEDPANAFGALEGSGQAVFMLGVRPEGRVEVCLPLEREGLASIEGLTGFFRALRFAPVTGTEDYVLSWGRVRIRW